MDSDRDATPFVTDHAGRPLAKNPLKDPRVRRAISKAINRQAIVEKVMEGEAIPSGQLVAEFLFGATKSLKVEPYDPEGAKKLLAEAGYPEGFGLTIHAPNNRYVNDAKIAQTVAQMLSRVGIDTKVVAMPSSTFFTQASDLKFSFMGGDTPELRAKFVATIPLGRLSLPSDIATAAVFFASDEAAFITGACLEVDGGRCV